MDIGITILVIFWLIVLTGVIVYFAVSGKEVGPIGPTGPTGPSSGGSGGPLTALNNCNSCNGGTTLVNGGVNIGAINGVNVAVCNPCQFYSLNADISNYQTIPGFNTPTIVRWAFTSPLNTNHVSYATNGMFTLAVGRYQLTTTIIYPAINRLGATNVSGNYKYMAIMLNDMNFNNVVTDNLLINKSQAIPIGTNNITQLTLTTTFDVTALRNKLSVLTWHDSSTALEIGTTTLNNITVASTFNLLRLN